MFKLFKLPFTTHRLWSVDFEDPVLRESRTDLCEVNVGRQKEAAYELLGGYRVAFFLLDLSLNYDLVVNDFYIDIFGLEVFHVDHHLLNIIDTNFCVLQDMVCWVICIP